MVFFVQNPEQSNPSPRAKTGDRLRELRASNDVNDDIDANVLGDFERFSRPFGRLTVVDQVLRAQLASGLKFLVGGRGGDDGGSGCGSDLGTFGKQVLLQVNITILPESHSS